MQRLDQLLVKRGLFETRARAADAIALGQILVDGKTAKKAGQKVTDETPIVVDEGVHRYVSRAALKLRTALDHFEIDPADRVVLDLGASTGGFTEVLLEQGARRVFAVDVGHGQLHERLLCDPRVLNMEGLNARDLTRDHFDSPITGLVSDVSFISLRLALPLALKLLEPGSFFAVLVKPQFEVGRTQLGKGGIVRNAEEGLRAAEDIRDWIAGMPGFRVSGMTPSPIAGRTGNIEYLLGGWFDG